MIMRNTLFVGVYPGLTEEAMAFIGRTCAEFFASKLTKVPV